MAKDFKVDNEFPGTTKSIKGNFTQFPNYLAFEIANGSNIKDLIDTLYEKLEGEWQLGIADETYIAVIKKLPGGAVDDLQKNPDFIIKLIEDSGGVANMDRDAITSHAHRHLGITISDENMAHIMLSAQEIGLVSNYLAVKASLAAEIVGEKDFIHTLAALRAEEEQQQGRANAAVQR